MMSSICNEDFGEFMLKPLLFVINCIYIILLDIIVLGVILSIAKPF